MSDSKKKTVKKNQAGKGDAPRPYSISLDKFAKNWELAFGKQGKKDGSTKKRSK